MDKNNPTLAPVEPIEIGNHGYTKGALFYLGLTYKRVKGKIRVRGPRKDHYVGKENSWSPEEWKTLTKEERENLKKKLS